MNETLVTIVGNVATAPKGRMLPSGDTVVNFKIASNARRRSAEGEWSTRDSLFVRVDCWRRLAENVLSSCNVGDPVVVRGRLYTDEYEWEGQRRSETRMTAFTVGPDLNRCTADITRTRRGEEPPPDPQLAALSADDGRPPDAEPSPQASIEELVADDGPAADRRERVGAGVEAAVGS
jgi:single-strand DNA-binding protein